MNILAVILIILLVFVLIMTAAGIYFCQKSLSRNWKKGIIYTTKDRIYQTADVDWFENNHRETEIKSSRGLKQIGYVFEHEEKTDYWIIAVHGYSSQARNIANHIKGFYNMGYNVVAPELMGMGKSEGDFVAMAGYDAEDLILWIDRLNKEHPEAKIGLFGVSMGAATVMNSLGKGVSDNVEFFIEDSGYTNLKGEIMFQLKYIYHLNFPPIMWFADIVCKIKYGYFFGDVNAEPALAKIKIPGLILHGDADDFVPPEFAEKAYGLMTGPKEIKYFKGSKHIRAEHWFRDEYWNTIRLFLEKYSSKEDV